MALTDKFKKAGAGTVTTLAAPGKAMGASSITVGTTANMPTTTGIIIAIRVVDTDGKLVPGTYTEWSAIVSSGTTLTLNTTPVYGNDQVYAAGSTTQVYIPLSASGHNTLVDGLLVSHDQDGTLKAGAVDGIAVLAAVVQNSLYPVGSIYINAAVATNPAGLLGFGTWAAFGAGRVMVGLNTAEIEFDALEKIGGAKTHTLSTDEMPAHNHTLETNFIGTYNGVNQDLAAGLGGSFRTGITSTSGSGLSHNNLQPYITVYMWKRTA